MRSPVLTYALSGSPGRLSPFHVPLPLDIPRSSTPWYSSSPYSYPRFRCPMSGLTLSAMPCQVLTSQHILDVRYWPRGPLREAQY
eukprot:2233998-Rhodomonas_salina.3